LVIQAKPLQENTLLTLNLEGRQFPYGKEGRYEQLYPDNCIGEVIGFPPGTYDMSIGTAFINPMEDSDLDIGTDGTTMTDITTKYLLRSHKCFDDYFFCPLPDSDEDVNDDSYRPLTEQLKCIWLLNRNQSIPKCGGIYKVNLLRRKDYFTDNQYGWIIESTDNLPHGEYYVYVNYLVSPNPIELIPHKYILLRMPKCHRFNSKDKSTQMSFAKIPIGNEIGFLNQNGIGVIKYFKPPLPRLDSLQIQFMPYKKGCDSSNRELFDFAGGEHVLVFALVFHKQNLKYSELVT